MKNILEKTIHSLSKKELINYKMYANRSNKTDGRKDIALFDKIKNSDKTEIENIQKTENSDNFRKLKNRLLDEIGTSLVQFYFHDTAISYIYNELNLAHIFTNKNELPVAYFHLQRAEKMATKIQDFRLLDNVYNELIKLAIFYGEISTYDYIEKRKSNLINLKNMQLFDDALSVVNYELHRNQALSKTPQLQINNLTQLVNKLNKQKEFRNNIAFKLKLFEAVTRTLIAQRQFITLENYCLTTYSDFSKKNIFTKDTHETKLQLLRYICSSLCENKKHELALEYLKIYYEALNEYNGLLYNKHLFFYYNSMANNYSVLNPHKAIDILNEAKGINVIANFSAHLLYIYWNLAGAFYDTENHKDALKQIIALKKLDSFIQLNNSLKLHIELFELILRVHLNQHDFAVRLLKQLSKDYKIILALPQHTKDKHFVKLLKKIISTTKIVLNKKNTSLINEFMKAKFINQSNNVVDYNKWLKITLTRNTFITKTKK